MTESSMTNSPEAHPLKVILLTLLTVLIGFVIVGPLVGVMVAMPFFDGNMMDLVEAIQNPTAHPEIKIPLYIMQGCATFVGLIVGPSILLMAFRRSIIDFFKGDQFDLKSVVLNNLIVIVFIGVISFFIEWNSNLSLPESLKGFEEWAREKEDAATTITTFLTHFDSVAQVFLALFVIAVLPGIGEELVFRGLLQKEFIKASGNVHLSIWVAAILFSTMHMQFFGFVPRMFLGALFGYLYYWSGSLSLAMLAHFINNGISVVALYFYQQGAFNFDLESAESLPWQMVAFSAGLTLLLLTAFKKYYSDKTSSV
jgi:membrane protease YdiL (CAAX protease family)